MKKFFVVLLSLLCLMLFTSCDPKISPEEASKLIAEAEVAVSNGVVEKPLKFKDGNLIEPIVLKSGVKLEKYQNNYSYTDTSASFSSTTVWVSRIDNKKHTLIMSATANLKESTSTSSVKLDGARVDYRVDIPTGK